MKTLMTLRIVSMMAMIVSYLIFIIPRIFRDEYYNETMIILLGLLIIGGPITLIARIKNEKNPEYLARTEKGMVIANFAVPVVITALTIAAIIMDRDGFIGHRFWIYVFLFFGIIYTTCNNTILYKAKKAYDAGKRT